MTRPRDESGAGEVLAGLHLSAGDDSSIVSTGLWQVVDTLDGPYLLIFTAHVVSSDTICQKFAMPCQMAPAAGALAPCRCTRCQRRCKAVDDAGLSGMP